MQEVLAQRAAIAASRSGTRPSRRYWAVVGNGLNRIAANELRIKLSELCYKSISCDITEDKKHIDLSAEPLILVCAAGLAGSNADDVAKEVAIYRAHRAAPIVIANEGDDRFSSARSRRSRFRRCTPLSASCSRAMAGHLFGYEAALAIDASARAAARGRAAAIAGRRASAERRPARRARAASSQPPATRVPRRACAPARYDGTLEAAHRGAARVAAALRDRRRAARRVPGRARQGRHAEHAWSTTSPPRSPTAIEELTRPIDAIKHQAKTVTVGISRSDETLLQVPLVREVLAAGRAARRAQLPVAAHARRARPGGRSRSPGAPATASRATSRPTRPRSTSSTRTVELRVAHARPTPPSAARSTASRPSARSPSRAAAATAARS